MGEILSQAEVEAILSAIEPSRPEARPVPVREPDMTQWQRHDFRQSEPLCGAALQVVQALHEGICDRWQTRLRSLLQADFSIRPLGACQSTATEFFAANKASAIHCKISHTGSVVESLLVWSSELARQLIGRMLGGADTALPDNCKLTKIEMRLLDRLNEAMVSELSLMLGDSLRVGEVLQSSDAVRGSVSAFPFAWFTFEVAGVGSGGLVHVGIPIQLGLSGAAASVVESSHVGNRTAGLESIPTGIQQISVRVSASLATLKLTAADLAALQVGDIVMTDVASSDSVALNLDGRRLGNAIVGTHLGRKALRVTP
ncbi:MAG: FliM/FliN family flagellar motor switch protein [Planctomycetota bacterium]